MTWRFWQQAQRGPLVWLMFCGAACRIDQLESETVLTSDSVQLELTRQLGTPPPSVQAELQLSEFVQSHFAELQLHVALVAGQGLAGQGLFAVWSAGADGETEGTSFKGPLQNELTLHASPSGLTCLPGPCRVVLALEPRGSWQSDVAYPLRYEAYAVLTLERRDRLPEPSDLDLRLELMP